MFENTKAKLAKPLIEPIKNVTGIAVAALIIASLALLMILGGK